MDSGSGYQIRYGVVRLGRRVRQYALEHHDSL